jgi:uncharacterized phage-associated protein
MRIHFDFDLETAIEVILYLAKHLETLKNNDIYHIGKVLYFADRYHLEEYGSFICGDSYIAMRNGPVPSGVNQMLQSVSEEGKKDFQITGREIAHHTFQVDANYVIPLREPNLNLLSQSERKCLDKSIKNYGAMSFTELRDLSHDEAYQSADINDVISIETIAATLRDGEDLIKYLKNPYPG